ncbi:MAG: hypothetical protein Q7R83_00465 [bacterium]|nr:hypothetical protein [bacterium]
MIRYGLKLWSGNEHRFFEEAASGFQEKRFDFIELYVDADRPLNASGLQMLASIPVTIHGTHNHGFHEFVIGEEQLAIWQSVLALADRFSSSVIVVHPGQSNTLEVFEREMKKIDDSRMLVENMPGLDLLHQPMFGQRLEDLRIIRQQRKICFDFEKAAKAAAYQNCSHQDYIRDGLAALTPSYFHLSGCDTHDPVDQHLNLWEGDLDLVFIKNQLEPIAAVHNVRLVFETPREKEGLQNDWKNMDYFRKIEIGS